MMKPTQITFRHMESSPSIEAAVAKEVGHLERIHPGMLGCEVVIDAPHQQKRQGRHFHVTVQLAIPGANVVASRDPGLDAAHEDVYIALRDAFRAVRRELETLAGHQHERRA